MKHLAFLLPLLFASNACTELRATTPSDDAGNDVAATPDPDAGGPDAVVFDNVQDAQDTSVAALAPDGSDAQPNPCISDCDEEGKARCTDSMHLQKCEAHDGCLTWAAETECGAMQLCCGSLCILASESSCYACGTRGKCGDLSPICDHGVKACICDDATCRAKGLICDGITHACIPDPASVYVDQGAPGGGDGTQQHPFRSITAALDAHPTVSAVMHVHVAPGAYNAANDERFPLVLRGVSLEGAGPGQTIIAGTGKYDSSASKGVPPEINATVVIGDTLLASGVSNLTVYDPGAQPVAGHHGVFCDRGNVPVGPVPTVAPNTKLAGLKVGPGYDRGVIVTTSTKPATSGCNMQVTGTNFKVVPASSVSNPSKLHQVGLWGIGAENPAPGTCAVGVMIQLGNGVEVDGNRFDGSGFATAIETSIELDTCVYKFSSSFGYFSQGAGGVELRPPSHGVGVYHAVFTHNTFDSQRRFGISAKGAYIDDLSDNFFRGIEPWDVPGEAFALLVEGAWVVKARRNTFQGNQVGVVVRGGSGGGDFGTMADPGKNSFLCNYTKMGVPIGGDVMLLEPQGNETPWAFAGNAWDHSPPHTATTPTVEGTDLTIVDSPLLGPGKADTSGSTLVDTGCSTP